MVIGSPNETPEKVGALEPQYGVPSSRKEWLRFDVITGLTTAAVVIPKTMAYATNLRDPGQLSRTQRQYDPPHWRFSPRPNLGRWRRKQIRHRY